MEDYYPDEISLIIQEYSKEGTQDEIVSAENF